MTQSILIIAVAAIGTMITRAIPFLLFGGDKEVPKIIQYLGKILPPAIMGTLIIYCIKSAKWGVYPGGIPELISIALVVLLHAWKKNTLISIGAGTLCYMVLVQVVFI